MGKERKQMFVGTFEGKVKSISTQKYYLSVVIDCIAQDTKSTQPHKFRIYDSNMNIFKNTISKGDIINGECVCNLYDKNAKTYNKIRTFKKKETSTKISQPIKKEIPVSVNSNTVYMMQGVITNLENSRDTVGESDVAFCFKGIGRKKVDFIAANKLFTKSVFYKKGQKVFIEVVEEKRKTVTDNTTLRLITMWHS